MSDVLIEEHDRLGLPEQTPVYYVSEALYSTKTHYPELEKMIYGVVMASRKLKHYFTVHPVTVPTTFRYGKCWPTRRPPDRSTSGQPSWRRST